MNYYGTRRRGHDLAFHSELRDALFASGMPFLVSINDAPEAWELYSRAGSITRLCSGKNSSKPELLVPQQDWPEQSCCRSRIEAAILSPQQDCQGRTRPAPGPHVGVEFVTGHVCFFFAHFEDFSAVSQTVRICKFSGERQRNTRPANLKKLTFELLQQSSPRPLPLSVERARTRPAPGPHQARTRPAPGPHQAAIRLRPGARSDFRLRFSKLLRTFRPQRER